MFSSPLGGKYLLLSNHSPGSFLAIPDAELATTDLIVLSLGAEAVLLAGGLESIAYLLSHQ